MLIEAPYKNGDIVTLKLNSGEELVGKLEEEIAEGYKIKTPLTLVMAQQGMGLQQYLFTAEANKSHLFKKTSVTIITKTMKQFAEAYQNQTSGLVTAPAGIADSLKTK